ncbi:MAG: ADP-ribosylglycohydrolase family protein [Acholeplasmataceae bacterium]|nr:ADP-ribosylglycohydrolase family protein [Acholeplasmataceae bacterium]
MEKYLYGSLVANAASLGYHWVYNSKYLEELSLKKSLLFQVQDQTEYDAGKPSYFVYPHQKVGDVSTQGSFMIWLYQAMKDNSEFTKKDYEDLIYKYIKPGGDYSGYVESYGKLLVIDQLNKDLKLGLPIQEKTDDHLVGFIPYLVAKELGLGNDKAFELTQLFTNKSEYFEFFKVFDYIFDEIQKRELNYVLKDAIKLAPIQFTNKLAHAIEMEDTQEFIKGYAGISCYIQYSIPLIFHLLAHSKSYEELIEWNTRIGGASSDRGLLLGAIMSQISTIPESWRSKVTF